MQVLIDLLDDDKVVIYEEGVLAMEYADTPVTDHQTQVDQVPPAPHHLLDEEYYGVVANEQNDQIDPPPLGAQEAAGPMALYHGADEDCCICLQKLISQPSARTNCMHNFHTKCLQTWYMRADECPLCRKYSQPIQFLLPPPEES